MAPGQITCYSNDTTHTHTGYRHTAFDIPSPGILQNLETTDAPLGREWIKASSQFPVHIHDTAETVQYSLVQDSTGQVGTGHSTE